MTDITVIEGIADNYAARLRELGVSTTEALLERGGTPKGRDELAKGADISPKLILEWVNRADLIRIKGVAGEYSDLLEAAGVDTVVELSHRNTENLHQKLVETNAAKQLVRQLPSQNQVTAWIEEAKTLPRKVSY